MLVRRASRFQERVIGTILNIMDKLGRRMASATAEDHRPLLLAVHIHTLGISFVSRPTLSIKQVHYLKNGAVHTLRKC